MEAFRNVRNYLRTDPPRPPSPPPQAGFIPPKVDKPAPAQLPSEALHPHAIGSRVPEQRIFTGPHVLLAPPQAMIMSHPPRPDKEPGKQPRIVAKYMGYATATTAEMNAMKAQTKQHEKLVSPNQDGKPASLHIQTHDPDTQQIVWPPISGNGPAESGQVHLWPANNRPISDQNPLVPLYVHPHQLIGPGKNDGASSGVSLETLHPLAAVVSHVHPYEAGYANYIPSTTDNVLARKISDQHPAPPPGRKPPTSIINVPAEKVANRDGTHSYDEPTYIRLGHNPKTGESVYWTLRPNPAPGTDSTPPASPSRFNAPKPGDTSYPAGPPGPYKKIHPAGPDHISNRALDP
jgi:hypothetical protein